MSTFAEDLKSALGKFEGCVKADLEEIRRQKNEIQSIKEQIYSAVSAGRYVRDDNRLILSAPEIIIGNVDHDGVLWGEGGSRVIIRGNEVDLEGTGTDYTGGSVVTRAASIRQVAVDPGKDGAENVLCTGRSEVVSVARSISLRTENSSECLVSPSFVGSPGITLSSDDRISISATPSNKVLQDTLTTRITAAGKESEGYAASAQKVRQSIDDILKDISECTETQASMLDSDASFFSNEADVTFFRQRLDGLQTALSASIAEYIRLLSLEAEANRQAAALKKMKSVADGRSGDFATKTNKAHVSIISETINCQSADGDGNVRTNLEAGIFAHVPHVEISSTAADGHLVKDGSVSINVMKFDLSTADAKLDEKKEKGDYTASGDVTVISKNVTVQSIDRELKDKKVQEKALTKGGSVTVRAEGISVDASDTEGKSAGEINMNARNIRLASMDLDKEKRTDKEMAAGSQMVLLSEKLYVGAMDKKKKSKLVQMASDKVAVMADTTAEMQQGEGKAVVTLDGGNLAAGGGTNEFSGDTTIKGKADIKGDTTAPKGSFKNLEAGSSFKSSNISDGIAVPAPASPGKPSAKMKMEEVKPKQ